VKTHNSTYELSSKREKRAMPFGFSKFLTAMPNWAKIKHEFLSFVAIRELVSRIAARLPKTDMCFLYFERAGGKLAT
jgi:hypothetical protein